MRLLTDKSTRAVGGGNCGGSNGNLSSGGGNGSSCGSLIESSGIEMSYFLDKPEGKSRARWRNDSGDNRVRALAFETMDHGFIPRQCSIDLGHSTVAYQTMVY